MEPEAAHDLAIQALRMAQTARLPLALVARSNRVENPRLEQRIWDCSFPNPVGLAAGFDKNGEVLAAMQALGFGFLEAGTVTPMPQRGNPRPRMFRFPSEKSLQNSLGFNNQGVERLRRRLHDRSALSIPLGVNIGKNKQTPAEDAIDDYTCLVERLTDRCDYFVVNVSSPNTPGLRDMQQRGQIEQLLAGCLARTDRPVLVKLAPDLELTAAVELSQAAVEAGAAGIILTNTTIDYALIEGAQPIGGLSGRVLCERSYEVLCAVAEELFGRTVLISVGGIDSAAEVMRRLRAGASLVQIYTGMVYGGPGLIGEIVRALGRALDEAGVETIDEMIGADRSS